MQESQFWKLIDETREASEGEVELQAQLLSERLAKMGTEEIVGFQEILDQQMSTSYRADLWAAAYMINGGCSDDGFDYFRGWLIAQGDDLFRRALDDPDTLAEVAESDVEGESLLYVAQVAHERSTGNPIPATLRAPHNLVGDENEIENPPAGRFPKLRSRFG